MITAYVGWAYGAYKHQNKAGEKSVDSHYAAKGFYWLIFSCTNRFVFVFFLLLLIFNPLFRFFLLLLLLLSASALGDLSPAQWLVSQSLWSRASWWRHLSRWTRMEKAETFNLTVPKIHTGGFATRPTVAATFAVSTEWPRKCPPAHRDWCSAWRHSPVSGRSPPGMTAVLLVWPVF